MINSVVLVGVLQNKPKKIKNNGSDTLITKNGFGFYELIIKIKSPNLKYWKEDKHNEITVKTFDFNLRKFLPILDKNILVAIKGRICKIDQKTIIFADKLFIIGKEK